MSPEKMIEKSRVGILRIVNRVVLWASLLFLGEWGLYGLFRCPFVVPFVSCQNCPVITCPGRLASMFWGFWGAWLAVAVFFGRAFCGWICPGGLANRIVGAFASFKLPAETRQMLPYGKYLLLIVALWVWFVVGQPRTNVPIRVGEFWASIGLTFEHASDLWLFRTSLVLFFLAAGIAISAAWCRFACPFGGALELFKRFSVFKVYKTSDCNDCDACRRSCYMRTRPEEANCTNCGDCLGACPRKCIHMGRKQA